MDRYSQRITRIEVLKEILELLKSLKNMPQTEIELQS